jgi:hypothetical protein
MELERRLTPGQLPDNAFDHARAAFGVAPIALPLCRFGFGFAPAVGCERSSHVDLRSPASYLTGNVSRPHLESGWRRSAMTPTSMTAKVPGEISAPINPEFDSSAVFVCNTSPDTFTTLTVALGMVKSPIFSSFTSPVPNGSMRPSPASSTNLVPDQPRPGPPVFCPRSLRRHPYPRSIASGGH